MAHPVYGAKLAPCVYGAKLAPCVYMVSTAYQNVDGSYLANIMDTVGYYHHERSHRLEHPQVLEDL